MNGKKDSVSTNASPVCTKTNSQKNPWWRVDFQRQVKVTGLRVYGRSVRIADLAGFQVRVGNEDYPGPNAACAVNQAAPQGPNFYSDITCTKPVMGQYLYIDLMGDSKTLSLCEVQVWGEEVPTTQGGYDAWALGASNEQKWRSGVGVVKTIPKGLTKTPAK